MADWSSLILNGMTAYGPWVLGLATLFSALGAPVPATALLLTTGALAQQGAVSWPAALALAALGAILGDYGGYWLGRRGSAPVCRRPGDATSWEGARAGFARWGGGMIFLSRFLLTPLAVPTNLLAGAARYPAWRFAGLVIAGEVLWVTAFGGLGYAMAGQWFTL